MLDVDLLAVSEAALHLLGENGSGSEPAHQLQSALRALISAALVGENAAGDILETPRDGATPIDIGQQGRAIRHPRTLLA
jgi:hypothetical protein